MRRLILFIFLIFIAGLVLFLRTTRAGTPKIKTEEAKRTSFSKIISASGKIVSQEEVELKFQTSGQLAWVGVKEGDEVQAWQAIAQLDTKELQKTLEKYLRDYAKQRNDFEEMSRETYHEQTPSTALTNTVKRILEKNQWDLDKAVLDVELKDIALKYATLVTPISGIVTQVETPVAGINITPATAVFKVSNPEKMIFRANIDEADIAKIVPDLFAKIILDAYPDQEFTAKVTKVGFAATSTSGGGTAFPVEIDLPQNDGLKFKSGMNGDTEIIIQKKENVFVVPNSALTFENNKTYLWKLVVKDKPQKFEVNLGLQNEQETEILEGLNEGDKVVSDVKTLGK